MPTFPSQGGIPPGFAQLDTDLQELNRAVNRLIVQTSLGVVVQISQGGTGATTAPQALINLGVGSAGTKAASNPADANVASVLLPVTSGHIAVFADTAGTIQDGGTLPGSFGSAASKAASATSQPVVSSVVGAITAGHVAIFADTNGSVEDGGVIGTIATQSYSTGTWTPTLRFGGSGSGITYSSNLGSYTQIGREIICRFMIVMTNKGSATGAATIVGLPFTSNADATNSGAGGMVVNYSNLASISSIPVVNVGSGSNVASLLNTGAAATSPLSDTNFTNISTLSGTFTFFT